jgi:hypothetical protein
MVHDLLPVETVELILSLVSYLNDDARRCRLTGSLARFATVLEELDARLQDLCAHEVQNLRVVVHADRPMVLSMYERHQIP